MEHVCLDAMSEPKIKELIDTRSYIAFEEKFHSFEIELMRSKKDWMYQCGEDSGLALLGCLNKAWPNISEKVFERWSSKDENKEFSAQKSLFLQRATNNAGRIKRSIASENTSQN